MIKNHCLIIISKTNISIFFLLLLFIIFLLINLFTLDDIIFLCYHLLKQGNCKTFNFNIYSGRKANLSRILGGKKFYNNSMYFYYKWERLNYYLKILKINTHIFFLINI